MLLPLTVYRISNTLFPNEVILNMNKHNHHNSIYHNEKLRMFCSTSAPGEFLNDLRMLLLQFRDGATRWQQ